MAKTTAKPAQPEEKMISKAEHARIILLDRYLTFHTLSVNRSLAAGDPQELRDAAEWVKEILLQPAEPKPEPTNEGQEQTTQSPD